MTSHCVWVYIILYLNYRNVSQTVHPHKQNVLYSKYHIIMISPLGMYLPWSCKFHSNCHRTCGYYIVWTGSEQSLPVMPAAPSPPCCKLWTAPLMKWRPMPWRSWLQLSGRGGSEMLFSVWDVSCSRVVHLHFYVDSTLHKPFWYVFTLLDDVLNRDTVNTMWA